LHKGKDVLTLQDFSADEFWSFFQKCNRLKKRNGLSLRQSLKGKTLAMIFEIPSTRTRISFEVAMRQLGGDVIILDWNNLQLSRGETLEDTARTLDLYIDIVVARVTRHEYLERLADSAEIPIVNGMSDRFHPCQALSDIFSIWEKKGEIQGLRLAWVGDGNNVCSSLILGCSRLGIDMVVACPKGYEPEKTILLGGKKNAKESGSKIELVRDPKIAATDADIIYTDTFVSTGKESEREDRQEVFLPRYQVTQQILELAKEDVIFMHCLPAHRGEEVTHEVLDGPKSIVWDQAENRLHTQKTLLSEILE
jgi:ornithine carbamoyltransferase